MNPLHYDPTLFDPTGEVAKLNEKYSIHIGEGPNGQYRLLIYRLNLPEYNSPTNYSTIMVDYTMLVHKTEALNKCFKIYQQNSQVGAKLFVKALDIDLLEELEKWNNRGV